LAELFHRTIYFLGLYEKKFGIFGEFFALAALGVKGLTEMASRENSANELGQLTGK